MYFSILCFLIKLINPVPTLMCVSRIHFYIRIQTSISIGKTYFLQFYRTRVFPAVSIGNRIKITGKKSWYAVSLFKPIFVKIKYVRKFVHPIPVCHYIHILCFANSNLHRNIHKRSVFRHIDIFDRIRLVTGILAP